MFFACFFDFVSFLCFFFWCSSCRSSFGFVFIFVLHLFSYLYPVVLIVICFSPVLILGVGFIYLCELFFFVLGVYFLWLVVDLGYLIVLLNSV